MGNTWSSLFGFGASRVASLDQKQEDTKSPLVVLITGASSGIGKECALTLIRRGYIVYGGARRLECMLDLVQEGGHAVQLDVCNDVQVQDVVDRIIQEQGRIDVLINNAGVLLFGPCDSTPLESTRRVFDVNFFGAINLTQRVIPHMFTRNNSSSNNHNNKSLSGGFIINISSIAGQMYAPYMSTYTASKHALENWSDALRCELAKENIHVSILQPGYVRSDIYDETNTNITPSDSRFKERVEAFCQRFGDMFAKGHPPSVVADAVLDAIEKSRIRGIPPKRRYEMGFLGPQLLFLRRWLGDWFWDMANSKS